MNYQKEVPKEVVEILKKQCIAYCWLDYYAFPEMFGSTAGPHGGIGGAAMSKFTIEAWVVDGIGPTIYRCGNRIKIKIGEYKQTWF
ncbi:MAG: hypothetical protein F6K19_01470 [Cyanothece sp. SIO1E1]|nr:hypothetical protein [Cyanothece sp. SIO1E1]